MSRYFKDINDLQELRKQYKDLIRKHHPDNGGNVSDMQEINAEYDKLFKVLKDRHESKSADSKERSYENMKYDFTEDQKLREVLQRIISFSSITINIVGSWIWIDGNTYPYKDELKAIGFRWSRQHKKWHWHNGEYIRRGKRKLSYAEIQIKYGSTEIQPEKQVLLQA